jgi:hypothetical protein
VQQSGVAETEKFGFGETEFGTGAHGVDRNPLGVISLTGGVEVESDQKGPDCFVTLTPFFVRNFHRDYVSGTFAPLPQPERCWYSKP